MELRSPLVPLRFSVQLLTMAKCELAQDLRAFHWNLCCKWRVRNDYIEHTKRNFALQKRFPLDGWKQTVIAENPSPSISKDCHIGLRDLSKKPILIDSAEVL